MIKVWENKLDNKYEVFVERKSPYNGELVIREGEKELLREAVTISYNAPFGPDAGDVQIWQDRCCEFIDKLSTTN